MTVREALRNAYLQTTYRVCVATNAEPVDIRIGVVSPALDRLLQAHQVCEWAFVTASNPRSQELADSDNAQRNDAMKQSLRDAGWRYLEAVGLPDHAGWRQEQSVLILGIGQHAAMALARRWQQNAIVCGKTGAPPELVWIE